MHTDSGEIAEARFANEQQVNVHIGRRIRRRRMLLGMTQMSLGAATGLQFQQIQKYECGGTRISASRLHSLAHALKAPVQYFYQGAPSMDGVPPSERDPTSDELLASKEARDLIESYYRLPDRVRAKLRDFAKVLGEDDAAVREEGRMAREA